MSAVQPAKSILASDFKYTHSSCTDIRKTFERERARLKASKKPAGGNVARLKAVAARSNAHEVPRPAYIMPSAEDVKKP